MFLLLLPLVCRLSSNKYPSPRPTASAQHSIDLVKNMFLADAYAAARREAKVVVSWQCKHRLVHLKQQQFSF